MSSFLRKSFRPLTAVARATTTTTHLPASHPLALTTTARYSSTSTSSSETAAEEERIFPVYMHHVSKIVLQHLQDAQSDWLVQQGLDRGLHVKSNGTFLLHFPARQGHDAGKLW